MVNRVALIVRPRQPYVDWANGVDDEGVRFDLAEHCERPEVLLLPEWAAEDLPGALAKCWEAIFEQRLEGWSTDTRTWPRRRTHAMFSGWFEVELGEPVWDLGDEPLEGEP